MPKSQFDYNMLRRAPHLGGSYIATRQYAYLVKQMGSIISLSDYVFENLFLDDTEQWATTPERQQDTNRKDERAEENEAQLQSERRKTFNSIMLCQIYDAFDLYCVRMQKLISAATEPRRGFMSNLDYNRNAFTRNGLKFLMDETDYKNAVMIKDSRNLITHSHGEIDERFHRKHPSYSDGVGGFLHIYSEELQDYTIFLTLKCYELDHQLCRTHGLEAKPVGQWTGSASVNDEAEDS